MALELRDAASQYALLEKETKEKMADLEKALQATKETRSEARTAREEIRQARGYHGWEALFIAN